MHVRYVGHSCLRIEMAGQRILTNPWWEGPAYDGLWCPHEPRVERSDPETVTVVCITDEGEDHLHVPTLRSLSRQAIVLVPRLRDLSLRDFLLSLGFEKVIELAHQRVHEVAAGLHATLYRQGDGNLLVLQGDGRIIVHANSAAQSGNRDELRKTAAILRRQVDDVDLLFASRHNHSWVPHCVSFLDDTHAVPRQWDKMAESRFFDLVQCLEPRIAFPLEDPLHHLMLRNAVPIEAKPVERSIHPDERSERVQMFFDPGDCVLDDQFVPMSQSRHRDAQLLQVSPRNAAMEEGTNSGLDAGRLSRLCHRILRNLRERAPRLLEPGQEVQCRIDFEDQPEVSLYVRASRTDVSVGVCDSLRLSPIAVGLRLDVLESWVTSATGYRSLTTAMGARWILDRHRLPDAGLLVDLLGRRRLPPSWTERLSLWLVHPRRAFDIWRQGRLQRCGSEQDSWDRLDPYMLLQGHDEEMEQPAKRIA